MSFEEANETVVRQTGLMVDEMLYPEMLGTDFPIILTASEPHTWADVDPETMIEYGIWEDQIFYESYQYMTYVYQFQFKSEKSEEFIYRIATAYEYFIEMLSTQYGLWGTTNPSRL